MPAPTQPLAGASAIPPNPELNALIQQSIQNAGAVPPVQQSQAPPAARAPANQQDWFSAMANGDDPDAGMEFAPPPQQAPPRQVQAAPQQAIPEFSEIDDLLRELPQSGVQAPVVVEQQQWQPQQQPPPPALPPPPAPPAMTPEQLTASAIDQLMGREYAIPEADARRLISEPETVLPRLAATVHVNAVRDIGKIVQQMMPQMIAAGVQNEIRAMRAEMEFFTQYPTLNRPEFKPFVEKGIQFARAQNPQADRQTVMREGATLAAHLIKSTYRRSGAPAPQPRASVAPYTPAAAFGGAPVPQNPNGNASDNIFTQLGNDPSLFDF